MLFSLKIPDHSILPINTQKSHAVMENLLAERGRESIQLNFLLNSCASGEGPKGSLVQLAAQEEKEKQTKNKTKH